MPISFARLARTALLALLPASGIRRGADTHRYALYLDTDLNPASGCSVSAINACSSYTEARPR
jgi:hypothetical protein